MTSTRPHYGVLDPTRRRKLANAVLLKIRNGGSVYTPEARMLWAIVELAAKDWLGLSHPKVDAAGAREAYRFLRSRQCECYLGLINIDHAWALEKLAKLKAVAGGVQ